MVYCLHIGPQCSRKFREVLRSLILPRYDRDGLVSVRFMYVMSCVSLTKTLRTFIDICDIQYDELSWGAQKIRTILFLSYILREENKNYPQKSMDFTP